MKPQLKTGILSFGMSGKVFHAPFIHQHPGFVFRGITERTSKLASKQYPDIISYNSVSELINDPEIDLVIVNTPSYTHFEYAKMALEAGKHVLLEKPFTATTAQANILFELAQKQNKQILVYQNRRFDSGFKAVEKVIKSGKLGKLVEVHFRYDRYRNEIGPKLFKEQPFEASGLLYDLGPHLIDQAICLFGKPLSFYKTLAKHRDHTQVDDYFSIQLQYPNDLNVYLTASMLVPEIKEAFVINGTKGSFSKFHSDVQEGQLLAGMTPDAAGYGIEDPADAGKLTLVSADGGREHSLVEAEKGNYMGIFDAVYQTIVHGATYPISKEDIIAQLEILEA